MFVTSQPTSSAATAAGAAAAEELSWRVKVLVDEQVVQADEIRLQRIHPQAQPLEGVQQVLRRGTFRSDQQRPPAFPVRRAVRSRGTFEKLEVPEQLFQRKRKLITRLEFHEFRHLGRVDRRQFQRATKRQPSRHPHAYLGRLGIVAVQKGLQRIPDQSPFFGLVGRMAKRFGVLDQGGSLDDRLLPTFVPHQLDGLQSAGAKIDPPSRPFAPRVAPIG